MWSPKRTTALYNQSTRNCATSSSQKLPCSTKWMKSLIHLLSSLGIATILKGCCCSRVPLIFPAGRHQSHHQPKKCEYSKNPHERTNVFQFQADVVLIYWVLRKRSASNCSEHVLKLCLQIIHSIAQPTLLY